MYSQKNFNNDNALMDITNEKEEDVYKTPK